MATEVDDLPDGKWFAQARDSETGMVARCLFEVRWVAPGVGVHLGRPQVQVISPVPTKVGQACSSLADPLLGGRPSFTETLDDEDAYPFVVELAAYGVEACEAKLLELVGAPGGSRTHDQGIMSATL